MIDGDDSDTWMEAAIRHSELAAHQIARFRNPCWNPSWRYLVPPRTPVISFQWGSRGKRSRPDTAEAARCVKGGEDSVACSPETPLDFGSGFGSEEGSYSTEKTAVEVAVAAQTMTKRRRVADGAGVGGSKMVGIEKAPLVLGVTAAKDNIRRTGRKKTLCELQEEEKKLIEEKHMIQKEMELRRRAYGVLKAENQRLKDRQQSLHSERVSVQSASTDSSSCPPSSIKRIILPDLNEPPPEDLC